MNLKTVEELCEEWGNLSGGTPEQHIYDYLKGQITSLESQLRDKDNQLESLKEIIRKEESYSEELESKNFKLSLIAHNHVSEIEKRDAEIERLKDELTKWKNGPWMTPDAANSYIRTSNERQDKILELREALKEYDRILLSVVCPDLTKEEAEFLEKCRKLIGE